MEAGVAARPSPLHAVLAAIGLLARSGPAQAVFVPVGRLSGRRFRRPRGAARVAHRCRRPRRRLGPPGHVVIGLPAPRRREHAAALRELDRLEAAAEKGRGLAADCDRRSRLPDAVEALLRVPALTPKALAWRLGIAPQTGTALLRELQADGVRQGDHGAGELPGVRDLTGTMTRSTTRPRTTPVRAIRSTAASNPTSASGRGRDTHG